MNILLWIFCEFSLPRLCIRFSGLLSGYFEMHIVCGNITQGAAIPHFDGGCRGGENRQGHLDFGFLDSWILCWGLAAWEMVKAHVRRSAAPLPLLLRNKCHSALCSELRLLLVSKKGPATLKGLVKFSGSGPPGFLGLPELPKPRAWKNQSAKEMEVMRMVMMKVFWPVSMSIFPLNYGTLPLWLFFDPKNTHFRTHLDLEWHLDGP